MKKTLLKLYLIISLLLLADILAYCCYKISLKGYYSDIILFWLWLGLSIAVIISYWKKILAKLLLVAMVLAIILSILPMAIPFYALIFSTTPYGLKLNKDLNDNYRAQIVGYSVMAYPTLQIIVKKGLLEKQVFQCADFDLLNDEPEVKIRDAKDVVLVSETDSKLTLSLIYSNLNKLLVFDKASGKVINK